MTPRQPFVRALGRPVVLVMSPVVALVVAVGLLAGVLGERAASPQGAPPAAAPMAAGQIASKQAAGGCADVLFVGADGRGERPAPGATFGPTLQHLYQVYAARTWGTAWSLETYRVPFSSQPLRAIKARASGPAERAVTKRSVKRWARGVGGASDRALARIRSAKASCPQQQIVLAGYAQGAAVVHRAAVALRAHPRINDRLTGIVLISDPDRVSRSRAKLSGSPAARAGGAGALARLTKRVPDLPGPKAKFPVWSVCNRGDVACDLGSNRIRAAKRAHNAYRKAGAAKLRAMGYRLYDRTIRHPKPTVSPNAVAAQTFRPVRARLAVDIAAGSARHVRFAARTPLPPGLLLGSNGLISGSPTTTGTWTVGYSVYSVESAEFGRRVPGVVVITVTQSSTPILSTGGGQTCTVRNDGTAWCWGRNNWGQLGTGNTTYSTVPVRFGSYDQWASIATSGTTTCATRRNGTLWCLGTNYHGMIGDGTRTARMRPVRVGDDRDWAMVSNSWFHTCAVKRTGTLWCWGFNDSGQLGDGTRKTRLKPRQVGRASDWATVSAGGWHTCATRTSGTLWCWGANAFGQLGDRTKARRTTPVQVARRTDWTSVSANWTHTCGVQVTGNAQCWGRNTSGQLGLGGPASTKRPRMVGGGPWLSVRTGDGHTCAVRYDGSPWCWGANSYGQLGTGSRTRSLSPVRVATAAPVTAVDASWVHSCAVQADGRPVCWGSNENGQLGDSTYFDRLAPVPVTP